MVAEPPGILCEWGETAVRRLSSDADVVVVVDVLSFTTCVDVAVSRGGRILPFRPGAPDAEAFAERHGAVLAGPRGQARFSLSPATYLDLEPGHAVVLPSPNGALATLAAGSGVVLAGCLRNAPAVAAAAAAMGTARRRILVVPAGERWPDGSLRPCLEDLLGAGAILSRLPGEASAEARAAAAAWRALAPEIREVLRACPSGRELAEGGHPGDVELAAEVGVSACVPVYDGEAFGSGAAS